MTFELAMMTAIWSLVIGWCLGDIIDLFITTRNRH